MLSTEKRASERTGTPLGIANGKFQIENLRSAICDSERSEDEGLLKVTDPLPSVRKDRISLVAYVN